ncbi:his operon leader peptide [Siccibacter colletis]|nr:his operon leader peptide [Siccibacter colletis]
MMKKSPCLPAHTWFTVRPIVNTHSSENFMNCVQIKNHHHHHHPD